MRIYKSYSKKKYKPTKQILRSERFLIFGCAVFVLGVVVGSLYAAVSSCGTIRESIVKLNDYSEINNIRQAFSAIIKSDLLPSVFGILFVYIMSCCAFGTWFILLYILFRGFGFGLLAGNCYLSDIAGGLIENLLILLPAASVYAFSLIIMSDYAVRRAGDISRIIFRSETFNGLHDNGFGKHIVHCVAFTVLSLFIKVIGIVVFG